MDAIAPGNRPRAPFANGDSRRSEEVGRPITGASGDVTEPSVDSVPSTRCSRRSVGGRTKPVVRATDSFVRSFTAPGLPPSYLARCRHYPSTGPNHSVGGSSRPASNQDQPAEEDAVPLLEGIIPPERISSVFALEPSGVLAESSGERLESSGQWSEPSGERFDSSGVMQGVTTQSYKPSTKRWLRLAFDPKQQTSEWNRLAFCGSKPVTCSGNLTR